MFSRAISFLISALPRQSIESKRPIIDPKTFSTKFFVLTAFLCREFIIQYSQIKNMHQFMSHYFKQFYHASHIVCIDEDISVSCFSSSDIIRRFIKNNTCERRA